MNMPLYILFNIKCQVSFKFLFLFSSYDRALAIAFNLPNIDSLILTREQMVGIYNGTYRWWNHTTFRATNPHITLPEAKIHACAREDKSGSTEVFTRTLSSISHDWNQTFGVFSGGADEKGNQVQWNGTAVTLFGKRIYGLADVIKSTKYSLGYITLLQAKNTKLPYASIINRLGSTVTPSVESAQSAMHSTRDLMAADMTYHLIDTQGKNSYPFTSYTYFIIRKHVTGNCDAIIELIRYLKWALFDVSAQSDCRKAFMVPLSNTIANKILKNVLEKVTCNGQNVHNRVLEILKEEEASLNTWKIPIMVVAPSIIIMTILIILFSYYQRKKINNLRDSEVWEIPMSKLVFYSPSSVSDSRGKFANLRKSVPSINTFASLGSEEILVSGLMHWPGKWNQTSIGLRIHEIKDLEMTRSMKRHIHGLREVIHENVLRFHGLISIDLDRYVISEYPSKGSLIDIIRDPEFNLNTNFKFSIAIDIAYGLSFLHHCGFIHGHFRSACCVLNSKWTVKIMDWELDSVYDKMGYVFSKRRDLMAEIREVEDNTDRALYLQFWVAPELIRSEWSASPNHKSDVYSYAIVLQEIFSRDDPYFEISETISKKDIIQAILKNNLRPQHDENTPAGVKQAMEIAWAEDPARRPSFDLLLRLLKKASPSKNSVLDNMMEAMEEYTMHLEEKVGELSSEVETTKQNMKNILDTFVPSIVSETLASGKEVRPEFIESATLLKVRYENFQKMCSTWSPTETVFVLNNLTTVIQRLLTLHGNVLQLDNCFNANVFVSGTVNHSRLKHAGVIATFALSFIEAFKEFTSSRKVALVLKFGMHSGSVGFGIVGRYVPRYTVFGESMEILNAIASVSEPMNILISRDSYKLLENIGGFTIKANTNLMLSVSSYLSKYVNKCLLS